MHAATCLSARVSTNKEVASAALFLATAVCWIALASFSAPTWGKSLKCLGLSFSFRALGCCGGWWLVVGAGMEGPFFCHRTSCPMGEAFSLVCKTHVLHNSVQRLEARILPGPCLFRGSSLFWGGVVVLRWLLTFYEHLAKELVLSYLTIITIIIFNNINHT